MSTATAEKAVSQFTQDDSAEKLSSRADVERPIILKAMTDPEFRKRLIADPKQVLESEFSVCLGRKVSLPANFRIKVLEESENTAYLIIPRVSQPDDLPTASFLDSDGGVAHYCTTMCCKPGFSC